ncbi:hypothetical protein OKW46_007397 [Paraburkholderia sp. WSM4179]|nr:hypothetical protein [Paraburkholderia sp. WSM4179]
MKVRLRRADRTAGCNALLRSNGVRALLGNGSAVRTRTRSPGTPLLHRAHRFISRHGRPFGRPVRRILVRISTILRRIEPLAGSHSLEGGFRHLERRVHGQDDARRVAFQRRLSSSTRSELRLATHCKKKRESATRPSNLNSVRSQNSFMTSSAITTSLTSLTSSSTVDDSAQRHSRTRQKWSVKWRPSQQSPLSIGLPNRPSVSQFATVPWHAHDAAAAPTCRSSLRAPCIHPGLWNSAVTPRTCRQNRPP